jgi:hypothetical protein
VTSEIAMWRYHLPSEKGEGWCIAFLDAIGVFMCVSDYGNYGYRWPQDGWGSQYRCFREFFLHCDDDYIMRKIARRQEYVGSETLAEIKRHILELRRGGSWSKDRARHEWDLVVSDMGGVETKEDFARWYDRTSLDEAYEFAVHDFHPQVYGFMKACIPRLRAAIGAQLQAERL